MSGLQYDEYMRNENRTSVVCYTSFPTSTSITGTLCMLLILTDALHDKCCYGVMGNRLWKVRILVIPKPNTLFIVSFKVMYE